MCSRVLGDRKWTRPGRVGAVCDAWVLGLLAAHVRGCRSARLCRNQGKGWVTNRRLSWRVESFIRRITAVVLTVG